MKNNIVVFKDKFQNIPPRYRGLSFDDFRVDNEDQKHIHRFAKYIISTFPEISQQGISIIFSGGVGTGKTMLAMIMMQELIRMDHEVCYESGYNFLNKLKEKAWHPRFTFQDALDYYKQFSLLIIDNFTKGAGLGCSVSSNEQQLLFELIEHRYQHKLNTILISNHNQEELTEIVGEALMSRIGEQGMTLTFNWDSYRKNKEPVCWIE